MRLPYHSFRRLDCYACTESTPKRADTLTAIAKIGRKSRSSSIGLPAVRCAPCPTTCSALRSRSGCERRAPLAARLRPRSLDEVVGQEHLLGPGRPLRVLIEADRLSSVILWGRPAPARRRSPGSSPAPPSKAFEPLSAVTAGVKDVREVVERARARLGEQGRGTILFLDEVHRFNRTQQDALLPHVEEGLLVLIGATTENPFFSLTGPLLSRSTLFRLESLDRRRLRTLLRARARPTTTAASATSTSTIDDDALDHLADRAEGDARHALTSLEVAAALAAGVRPRRRSRSPTPRPRLRCGRCATATTSTTTCCPRSSRASAAPIPTPGSTGWRACSRRGRTRASSRAGS